LSSRTTRRVDRCNEDPHQLICFIEQSSDGAGLDDAGVDEHFEPVEGFVRFFFGGRHL
jgi:hypothetical protein